MRAIYIFNYLLILFLYSCATVEVAKDLTKVTSSVKRTIEKIVFEKTSSLLNSIIVVSKQTSSEVLDIIKKNISGKVGLYFYLNFRDIYCVLNRIYIQLLLLY